MRGPASNPDLRDPVKASRRRAALAPTLVFTTMVAAVISSLGAPLIPSVAVEFRVPLSTAQWSLTVALLVGAVSAPVMGRLGDGPHRRRTLIAGLALVTLGGLVAGLADELTWLLVGRGLQGIGLGLVPLTISAARDHLPGDRVPGVIALLSVCAAAGVGAGYPLSGWIADSAGLSAAFWFGSGVRGAALLCVVLVVPSSAERVAPRLDVGGALLLTTGLVALLLATAEGNTWGWTSGAVSTLVATAVVALALWVVQALRASSPLVQLRLLRHPAVLTGDTCALVLGVAMYMNLSAVTEMVQTPRATGFGFSGSVALAGLCLVPFSLLSIAASRALPRLTAALGRRAVLPVGCLAVSAGGSFFALLHTALWQALVMMAVLGTGLGMTFAAIPGLIVEAVPPAETGSAMGFYQVVRYVGFSLGSAMVATILAANTARGRHLPQEAGFIAVLLTAGGLCVAAALLAWLLPGGLAARGGSDRELAEDEGELGSAGLVGRAGG